MTRRDASIPSIARVDHVVVGRTYLVPTILYDISPKFDGALAWPVIGPKHEDAEDFNFPRAHYHYDIRFFTRDHLARFWHRSTAQKYRDIVVQPLIERNRYDGLLTRPYPLPDPVWMPMRCRRQTLPYPFGRKPAIQALNLKWYGHQAVAGPAGWICPHRRAPLNGQPVVDGVITCPLHGLRIDAATGACLGPQPACDDGEQAP